MRDFEGVGGYFFGSLTGPKIENFDFRNFYFRNRSFLIIFLEGVVGQDLGGLDQGQVEGSRRF